MIGLAAGALMIGGCVFLAVDYARSMTELDGEMTRNEHGSGSVTRYIDVAAEDEPGRIPVEVEVREQLYTEEETQAMFSRITSQLETRILGENESLDRVEQDLDLLTSVPDEPVDISWELSRYDVMNGKGELQTDALTEDGTLVTLTAVLTYREDETRQAGYQCVARLFPVRLTGREELGEKITEAVAKAESEDREQNSWTLPDELDGKELTYYERMDGRGAVMIGMALAMVFLMWALGKQNQNRKEQEKREQMLQDYPEIVTRMALFLGAGMTVKRAFRKIAEEYERQKKHTGPRYAYEEMQKACREMESGHTESESYENFGKRCRTQEYLRFAALLSQNLRKGTKGIGQLLKLEAVQALEEKKARARRLGEEAATKLLLPMFLMLTVVLIIVIVPAFLSLQI